MPCVAVIPARRAERTIRQTLESLRLGNADFVERVLVVTSSDDPTCAVVREWARRDARVGLVLSDAVRSAGAARNDGREAVRRSYGHAAHDVEQDVAQDRERRIEQDIKRDIKRDIEHGVTPLLLFVDADCRLEAGGAARLASELERSAAAAVTPRIVGTRGLVARARHILEFKEAASMRTAPFAWLPPSTVMLCRTHAFDSAGGFPDLWPGEDLVFTQALRDGGGVVRRTSDVAAVHDHPRGVLAMLRHQWRLGRTAAIARRMRPMPGSALAKSALLAPLLFPARTIRIALWQFREGPAPLAWTLALSPLLLAGLAVWTSAFTAQVAAGVVGSASAPVDRSAAVVRPGEAAAA
ncbi:MAG TPA: glycosyltransferase family A protein [Candidatus Limnocylindrales bacterium]|nr:glycosyltransferase family A protein [Candidatus Limnocylindrales bacterium]